MSVLDAIVDFHLVCGFLGGFVFFWFAVGSLIGRFSRWLRSRFTSAS